MTGASVCLLHDFAQAAGSVLSRSWDFSGFTIVLRNGLEGESGSRSCVRIIAQGECDGNWLRRQSSGSRQVRFRKVAPPEQAG